ncbi:MAG TPA: nucleoside triphosphate pyrophosphohydrolase [Peptococcaceae bacterium]|nr:nucleoside triphosphate pyrophosphohydrolase [Peptococcaceae bacterium]HPZ71475.1 nucleoside triphosphate pyrophosphohydrolase [Peptococcaceae bacterium]HQD53940.1 nucleoside triphosphate pyrophosphohydrolase [Peptococcaceae bacterium]
MKEIFVVGLGAGSFSQLTLETWELLNSAELIFLRTARHPMVEQLRAQGIPFQTFDHLYEEKASFEQVYAGIAETLLARCKAEPPVEKIVYAVPGHPLVGEKSVEILLERAPRAGVRVNVYAGISFVDSILNLLQIDLTAGFAIWDTLTVTPGRLNLACHQLFTQVYNRLVASELKLTLLELYPAEHQVKIIQAAGIPGQEKLVPVPLCELDHWPGFDHLTSVYVPPLPGRDTVCRYPLDPLASVLDRLLAPDGCPWDREQTHATLKRCLLEETYEVLEAIDDEDMEELKEELGDVLLQVVFHAALAQRRGDFDLNEVVERVTAKMIHRHPHVFGEVVVHDADDVIRNWEKIKKEEKGNNVAKERVLDSVNRHLPALLMAEEVQKKARKVGFDWSEVQESLAKVEEELQELKAEISNGGEVEEEKARLLARREDELGDLLFAVVNVARFLDLSAEVALLKAVQRFIRRFNYIEDEVVEKGQKWEELDLKALDRIWEKAKSHGL